MHVKVFGIHSFAVNIAKRMSIRGGDASSSGKTVTSGDSHKQAKGQSTGPHETAPGETKIDESLYNRQLYVLGHDAMRRMQQANIVSVPKAIPCFISPCKS